MLIMRFFDWGFRIMKLRCLYYSQIVERFKCSILQYQVFEPMILQTIVIWVSFFITLHLFINFEPLDAIPSNFFYLCHGLFIDMCKVSSQKAWVIGAHCHLASGVAFILHKCKDYMLWPTQSLWGCWVNWSSYNIMDIGWTLRYSASQDRRNIGQSSRPS